VERQLMVIRSMMVMATMRVVFVFFMVLTIYSKGNNFERSVQDTPLS
jgi:hypothetical protein